MPIIRATLAALAVVLMVAFESGCDECSQNQSRCANGSTMEYCASTGGDGAFGHMTWQQVSCPGTNATNPYCVMLPSGSPICSADPSPAPECTSGDASACRDNIPGICANGFLELNRPQDPPQPGAGVPCAAPNPYCTTLGKGGCVAAPTAVAQCDGLTPTCFDNTATYCAAPTCWNNSPSYCVEGLVIAGDALCGDGSVCKVPCAADAGRCDAQATCVGSE